MVKKAKPGEDPTPLWIVTNVPGSDLKKGPHKLKGQKAVPYTPPTDIGDTYEIMILPQNKKPIIPTKTTAEIKKAPLKEFLDNHFPGTKPSDTVEFPLKDGSGPHPIDPDFKVTYPNDKTVNGRPLSPDDTREEPTVEFKKAKDDEIYTIVMVKKAKPGEDPTPLWIVTNVPGSDLKKGPHKLKGQKAVPYTPPTDIGDTYEIMILPQNKKPIIPTKTTAEIKKAPLKEFLDNHFPGTKPSDTVEFPLIQIDPNFKVTYPGGKHVNGKPLTPDETKSQPKIQYHNAKDDKIYSVVLVKEGNPDKIQMILSDVKGTNLKNGIDHTSGNVKKHKPYTGPTTSDKPGQIFMFILIDQNGRETGPNVNPKSVTDFKKNNNFNSKNVATTFFPLKIGDYPGPTTTPAPGPVTTIGPTPPPTDGLTVTYKTNNGDKVIPDHDTFTPDETKSEPHVKYVKAQNPKHYTIALINPKTNKILWFVSDIKGSDLKKGTVKLSSVGKDLLPYTGPPSSEPTGTSYNVLVVDQLGNKAKDIDIKDNIMRVLKDEMGFDAFPTAQVSFRVITDDGTGTTPSPNTKPLIVTYPNDKKVNGQPLTAKETGEEPTVEFPSAKDDEKYVLVLVKKPKDGSPPENVWMVGDIDGSTLKKGPTKVKGKVHIPYEKPTGKPGDVFEFVLIPQGNTPIDVTNPDILKKTPYEELFSKDPVGITEFPLKPPGGKEECGNINVIQCTQSSECGANAHCKRRTKVCSCDNPKQNYPNCCFPSCKLGGVCLAGNKCSCINGGAPLNCNTACKPKCGKNQECVKDGGDLKCVCRQNYELKNGKCTKCEFKKVKKLKKLKKQKKLRRRF